MSVWSKQDLAAKIIKWSRVPQCALLLLLSRHHTAQPAYWPLLAFKLVTLDLTFKLLKIKDSISLYSPPEPDLEFYFCGYYEGDNDDPVIPSMDGLNGAAKKVAGLTTSWSTLHGVCWSPSTLSSRSPAQTQSFLLEGTWVCSFEINFGGLLHLERFSVSLSWLHDDNDSEISHAKS